MPTKPSAPGDAFTLTLRDVFSNTYNVDVSSKTRVFEVKEKLRVANGEPIEYVDVVALLYNQLLLHDDSTLGSLGITESTTVMLSMQDPERGRAMRQERELREAEKRRLAGRRSVLLPGDRVIWDLSDEDVAEGTIGIVGEPLPATEAGHVPVTFKLRGRRGKETFDMRLSQLRLVNPPETAAVSCRPRTFARLCDRLTDSEQA